MGETNSLMEGGDPLGCPNAIFLPQKDPNHPLEETPLQPREEGAAGKDPAEGPGQPSASLGAHTHTHTGLS